MSAPPLSTCSSKRPIGPRQLAPVFKTYCPVSNTGELAACTSLTEDDKVFMAWGTFYDPTGDAQLCVEAFQHLLDQLATEHS